MSYYNIKTPAAIAIEPTRTLARVRTTVTTLVMMQYQLKKLQNFYSLLLKDYYSHISWYE